MYHIKNFLRNLFRNKKFLIAGVLVLLTVSWWVYQMNADFPAQNGSSDFSQDEVETEDSGSPFSPFRRRPQQLEEQENYEVNDEFLTKDEDRVVTNEISKNNVAILSPSLPIYIKGVQTSSGITTTINIYRLPSDEDNYVRLEIYPIDYQIKDRSSDDPELIAFRDSFIRAKEEIQKAGANPLELKYILATQSFANETAQQWVEQLDLL